MAGFLIVMRVGKPFENHANPNNGLTVGLTGSAFMSFLILNILFGSTFMLLIKWAHVRQTEDVLTIGAVNYIVAALLISPFFLGSPRELWTFEAFSTGASNGLAYFIAYFFVIFAIRWVGAASTTVISVLSILVPIGFGVYYWQEHPTQIQVVGIFLALGALSLMSGQKQTSRSAVGKPAIAPLILLIFFLLCGVSRLAQEAYRYLGGTQDEILTYNFAVFFTAAVPSVIVLCYRRKKVTKSELVFGSAMGLANFLQTQFILEALQVYPGFIVFPVVSAGAIIFTTLVATQTLGEHLHRRSYVGILIASISLILIRGGW